MGRATIVADAVCLQIPDSACIVYEAKSVEEVTRWRALAVRGEARLAHGVPADGPALFHGEDAFFASEEFTREDFAHLLVPRTVTSLGYLPFSEGERLFRVFEIITFGEPLTSEILEELQPTVVTASVALTSAARTEKQHQHLLDSVHRMSQLYDLEKGLNATLDFERLVDLIPLKVMAMIPCGAVRLWLFDGDPLKLMSMRGRDIGPEIGTIQAPGEGYVADMAEEGEPLLIEDPEDERLIAWNEDESITPVLTAMVVPLLQDEAEVGVLEAANKADGSAFDDDDLFFLNTMAETVSSALKNASLLLAERKLEVLEALVHVSSEITSTLRLERLLQIIVNSPQTVLPFERCAIALDTRGRLQLKAVSGMANIPAGDVAIEGLRSLIGWLGSHYEPLLVRQHEDDPEHEDEHVRTVLGRYFVESSVRAIYALPLNDEQGRVGMLLYESSDPDFLETVHVEVIKVLAGQATVAMRNALLYREVPLIQILEPLLQGKQKFLRSSTRRRWTWAAGLAAAAVILVFLPLPMRVSGTATVAPQHIVTVNAPVEANVQHVFAQEGQAVSKGDVMASLDDYSWRADLIASQARYEAAALTTQSDLARQSPQAGIDRAQADYLKAEMQRSQGKLTNASLRSPIDGIVITPELQNFAGKHLDAGAPFAQVLDLDSALVNIAIDEEDAPLLRNGQTAAIKLNSFPTHVWRGDVSIVGLQADAADAGRSFAARVPLSNRDGELRSGMEGRAKIFIGYRPAGVVLLRRPALWIWQTAWDWIGW